MDLLSRAPRPDLCPCLLGARPLDSLDPFPFSPRGLLGGPLFQATSGRGRDLVVPDRTPLEDLEYCVQ